MMRKVHVSGNRGVESTPWQITQISIGHQSAMADYL